MSPQYPSTNHRSSNSNRRHFSLGNRYSWAAMAFLWSLLAVNHYMRDWMVGILQPSIANEFDADAGTMGGFVGLLTVAQGILAIPLAAWSDRGGHGWARKGRYTWIVVAYTIFTILTALSPLTSTLLAVFAFQALNKVFSGAGEAVEVTSISEWWSLDRRGFAVGIHHTAVPWGAFIGGLIVSGLLGWWGAEHWRAVLFVPVVLVVPLLIGFWFFSTHARYRRFEETVQAAGGTPPLSSASEDSIQAPPGAFRRSLKNPNLVVSALLAGLALAQYTAINFWLPLYLAFVADYSIAAAAAFSVIFTLTGGLGQIFWGGISDRIGRKPALVISFVWLGLAVILLQFSGVNIALLIILQVFLGCVSNGVYPVLYAFSVDSSERGAEGLGNGLNMAGQMLGGIGPIVAGALIMVGGGYHSESGYFWALYFIAALMFISAVAVAFLTRETAGKFKHRDRGLFDVAICIPNKEIRER